MPRPKPFLDGPRPLCFAHRGGAKLWPENTLPALGGAVGLGFRYLETDVHLTRDGHLVVFHDERLERTTDGYGLLRDFTLSELERLDAGYWYSPDGKSRPWRGKGVRIPLLREVFELSPTLRVNVELKQAGVGLPRALWDFIEAHGIHDRILVASAEAALGREFRALARGTVATSASAREVLELWAATRVGLDRVVPIAYDALQVPPFYYSLPVVTPRFVRAAHARGLQIHVWTIDDPLEMRRLLALGVDGLMSDRPDLLLAVMQENL
ncbi:MAG: glycerophosphodiester phosphodiesterase [Myxococcales bacterium]|nr:glycerophosphodiester phosphodiesterase [Myxococcales bacterium]